MEPATPSLGLRTSRLPLLIRILIRPRSSSPAETPAAAAKTRIRRAASWVVIWSSTHLAIHRGAVTFRRSR